MTRRVSPSLTSRRVDELVARYPGVLDADATGARSDDAQICSRWVGCRQVYDFDPTLAEDLWHTDDTTELPMSLFLRLPHPIVCVRAPRLRIVGASAADLVDVEEFLAWADADAQEPRLALCALPSPRDRSPRRHYLYHLPMDASQTIGSVLESVREGGATRALAGFNSRKALDALGDCIAYMLALLAYVCSDDADMQVIYAPSACLRSQRRTRPNPDTVHAVGSLVGRRLAGRRKAYVAAKRSGKPTGNVRPHVRKAHWHYGRDVRKGSADGCPASREVFRWIAPVYVGVGQVRGTACD